MRYTSDDAACSVIRAEGKEGHTYINWGREGVKEDMDVAELGGGLRLL